MIASLTRLYRQVGCSIALKFSEKKNKNISSYMLDFIPKPGEYQDNASLFKFKGNPSIDTWRNRVGNSSVIKGFDQIELRASANHTHQ